MSYTPVQLERPLRIEQLYTVHYFEYTSSYAFAGESHDFWELCFVTEGEIAVRIEDKDTPLGENHLLLISPNKKHAYHSEAGNRNKAFVICFDSLSQALYAIAEYVFAPEETQFSCMRLITQESQATFRTGESDHLAVLDTPVFGGQQALLLQLEYLLITLIRRLSAQKSADIVFFSDENFHAELVNAIMRYLRENTHRKLSLDDVCERFNYSRAFICKVFKKQTGESLIACFNRMKAKRAAKLLRETAKPVTDIAAELGFKETKYFDTVFKKFHGISPVQYREESEKYRN
jgi:AraC-like DNA-binding protein